jgi:aerobic-type carbon monoxide dehydrogenase small subunit (CoxS/CutS family)
MTQSTTAARLDLRLLVNGEEHRVSVEPRATLLQVLRDELGLTSARSSCGIGICGACTVLVDGDVVSSCILLAAQVGERAVTTAEGLGTDGRLSQVQEAFVRRGAYQCSFCIPAMALTVHAALNDPAVGNDRESVREYLAGNLCRCGTYPEILQAVGDLVDGGHDQHSTGSDA